MKKIISVALILVLVLTAFAACKPVEEEILGTWTYTEAGLTGAVIEKSITFAEGGNGTMKQYGDISEVQIKWSIYEKNLTIEVTSEGSQNILQGIFGGVSELLGAAPITYTFKLKGDTLTLTAADGTETILTRQAA